MSRDRHLATDLSSDPRTGCDLPLIISSLGLTFQIQFSYRIRITSAALALRFVPEKEASEKKTIFTVFLSQRKTSSWIKGLAALPLNQSEKYHILLDVNAGMRQHSGKVIVAITNISLSKECFAIGMSVSIGSSACLTQVSNHRCAGIRTKRLAHD